MVIMVVVVVVVEFLPIEGARDCVELLTLPASLGKDDAMVSLVLPQTEQEGAVTPTGPDGDIRTKQGYEQHRDMYNSRR